ncbi:MAG: Stage sporulation family protein [Paenibacillus sp.]|jgi:serine phosphatase RsbU (regulator of sigma subunit)|nr:Stage sporulation family protein [Paenibacillus sp.]
MKRAVVSRRSAIRNDPLYDSGVAKVSAFAAGLLVVSIILTGMLSYYITKEQSVKKLKENDLVYIATSIAAKISGTIERAAETSRIMAEDREIREWISNGEKKDSTGTAVLDKLRGLKDRFQYDNSFIVSVPSGNYWSENGAVIDVMSVGDPDDKWFFDYLQSGKDFKYDIDRNEERNDTFVFVNSLMKSEGKPHAIVGVGLSLRDLSKKFEEYKYGNHGSLWLTDQSGTIYLSDELNQNGRKINDFLPADTAGKVLSLNGLDQEVLEYRAKDGRRNDLIAFPIPTTEWSLVVSVDREEAISFLKTIQAQTAIAVAIALFSVVFFFYYTSRKLADPFKRAVALNQQLENQISLRTKELAEQNVKILDSIDYASRILISALPSETELREALPDHFVLWKPRDLVGGDFYWIKRVGKGFIVAVGDCTGHGVPGALMSIMTVSLLDQIVDRTESDDPGLILSQLNRSIKQMLNQEGKDGLTDDGVDIGMCLITPEKTIYAGAGCTLYIRKPDRLQEVDGHRRAIGYRKTPSDHMYESVPVTIGPEDVVYLTTDGLADQNGGDKNYSFGKTRWKQWIESSGGAPLQEQKRLLLAELDRYRGTEPQRDDITVLGFRLARRSDRH